MRGELFVVSIILAGISFCTIILFALYAIRTVENPLKKLANHVHEIANGHLSQRLEITTDGGTINQLADAFNEIGALGDPERRACLKILKTFAEYRRSTHRQRV